MTAVATSRLACGSPAAAPVRHRRLGRRRQVDADRAAAVRLQVAASPTRSRDAELDLARLTDGLRAEREQGITIDVAYRHFSTPRRRFIIADTPGHAQYTRNMVTGASTADVAVVLVDAREGLLTQSRRHAAIAGLLRIPRIVLAVNKMDLVGYDAGRLPAHLRASSARWAARLDVEEIACIPISALDGDNVVERSAQMDWYARADAAASSSRPRRSPAGVAGRAAAAAGPVRDPLRRAARVRRAARGRDRAGGRRGRRAPGRARGRAWRRSRARTGRSTRPRRRCPSPCRWRTSSTSGAAR